VGKCYFVAVGYFVVKVLGVCVLRMMLVVEPERCTGCRMCELVCSFYHVGVFNPRRARITVVRDDERGVYVPMMCQHCEEPPCMDACPVYAIYRGESGAVLIDYGRCIGCRMCITACPFGGPSVDPVTMQTVKCDLCDGDPKCAKYCVRGAIQYVRADEAAMKRRIEGARRISQAVGVILGGEKP